MTKTYSVATFKISFNNGDEDSLEYKSYIKPNMAYRDYVTRAIVTGKQIGRAHV